MKSNFEQWKVFLEARRLQKLTLEFEELFTESGTRYSVEVNFRTNLKEAIDNF
jgi:hypothetical protein